MMHPPQGALDPISAITATVLSGADPTPITSDIVHCPAPPDIIATRCGTSVHFLNRRGSPDTEGATKRTSIATRYIASRVSLAKVNSSVEKDNYVM
jgi:hypothetical protein